MAETRMVGTLHVMSLPKQEFQVIVFAILHMGMTGHCPVIPIFIPLSK